MIILDSNVQAAMRERERREDIYRRLADKRRALAPKIEAMRHHQRGFLLNPFRFGGGGGGGGGSDPDWASVVLRLPLDSSFADVSTQGHTATPVGNAVISSTQKKWGTSSGYFDGSGDEVGYNSLSGSGPGTGNYAVEMWLYSETKVQNFPTPFSLVGSSNTAYLQFNHNDAPNRISWLSPAGRIGSVTQGTTTWYWVMVMRNGTTTKIYVDATETGSMTETSNYGTSASFKLGGYAGVAASLAFKGYIDDVRVSKVTRTVSIPTEAYPTS